MARKQRQHWNGESIRSLRRHLQMTQTQLAGELGIRQQTISEWESDIYKPRGATVTLLNLVAERCEFDYTSTTDDVDK